MIRMLQLVATVSILLCEQLPGQIVHTERVEIGKMTTAFYGDAPELSVVANKRKGKDNVPSSLTVSVTGSSHQAETASIDLTLDELATVIKNLDDMLKESIKSTDDLLYTLPGKDFTSGINGGQRPHFAVMVQGVMVVTQERSEEENRQTLQDVINLLKKGQSVLNAESR